MLGYRNTKAFLLKDIPKISLKKFLFLVKLRIQFCGHTRLVIPIVSQLLEVFMKKNVKTSQEKFRIKKVLKRKGDKFYVKWKGYDNFFNNYINK